MRNGLIMNKVKNSAAEGALTGALVSYYIPNLLGAPFT